MRRFPCIGLIIIDDSVFYEFHMAKIVFALNIAAKFFIGPRDLTFYRHMVCQTVRQPLRGFSIIINGRKGLTYSYDNILFLINLLRIFLFRLIYSVYSVFYFRLTSLKWVCSRWSQIGEFRLLRRNCATLRRRRMLWIVSECRTAVLCHKFH